MMQKLLGAALGLLALGATSPLMAQLPDYSPAPDWTAVDINGQSHHLQSYLDSGYTVLIDFSATWCGPCWNYHQLGILEQLYEAHGPDGTNTLRVFFIEGDDNTTLDNLHGIGPGTAGNWVEGTPYPIIDNGGAIFDAYEGNYFPTIYTVCPHGLTRESGQTSFAAHEAIIQNPNCAPASQPTDVWLMSYAGSTLSCPGEATPMAVQIMNLGTDPLTACTIEVSNLSGTLLTHNWTGSVDTYETATIDLGTATFNSTGFFFVELTSPDGNPANNSLTATMNVNALAATTLFQVSLLTDAFPGETRWAFRDAAGNEVAASPTGLAANTPYTWWVNLPSTGCYSFHLLDSYGDGMTGSCHVTSHLDGGWVFADIFQHNSSGAFSEKSKGLHVESLVVGVPDALEPASASAHGGLNVFPNPVTDGMLGLQLLDGEVTAGEAGWVQVLDARGVACYEQVLPAVPSGGTQTWSVPTAHLPAGRYLVRVAHGNRVRIASFLKS